MPSPRPAVLSLLVALCAALLAAGCSGVRVAYNSADFLIGRYADEYLGLDGGQLAAWQPTLQATLARHRADELPYLAAFADSLRAVATDGFTPARMECLLDQFEALYQRHFRLAAAAAAPLLAGLTPTQIDALAETFRQEAADDTAGDAAGIGPDAAALRARKRARRYEGNLDWWLGPLDSRQRGVLREVSRRQPDTGPAWNRWRDQQREVLIAMLRAGASAARIEAFLVGWVVEFRDLPPALRAAHGDLRRAFSDLFAKLDPTLSPSQRAHFVDRATRLRDDFTALQPTPRRLPPPC